MSDFESLLRSAGAGDQRAGEAIARRLYEELREMARREMRGERKSHTLQPTALVHDAWLRLVGDSGRTFESRAHFFAAAANAIRRVLVEHARGRGRQKRGGAHEHVRFDDDLLAIAERDERDDRVLALDGALERLAALDPLKARIVELRFFAGMTLDETAGALAVSPSTVTREWRLARAWLQGELEGDRGNGS